MNKLSPIVLFVYNRPWHTRQTVEALFSNELAAESKLIVFSDGAKGDNDLPAVEDVRNYLKTIKGFKSISINESPSNKGLANSVISGVTEVVNKYGRIIVLEDDMVTSPYFLRYMNDALEMYKDEEKVVSIHGYMYPIKEKLPETFFLCDPGCWGWATWKRGWDFFEADTHKLLNQFDKNLKKKFDFNNSFPFYKMLKNQALGKIDSWAIRWYASAFIFQKLTLWPGQSFVENIGMDNSGTHCVNQQDEFDVPLIVEKWESHKNIICEDNNIREKFAKYFISIQQNLCKRIQGKLKFVFNSFLKIL